MEKEETNFNGITRAGGLTVDEAKMLGDLVQVFTDRLSNNRKRYEYYTDKNPLKNIGLTIPADIARKVSVEVGWAAKAVEYLACRSQFDSLTSIDEKAEQANKLLADNDFAVEYAKAVPSQLVHGVGFWTVSRGEEGEQAVVINYHDATSAAALWDFRHKRVKCGFVVEDYELYKRNGSQEYRPCLVVLHTAEYVVTIQRKGKKWEVVGRQINAQGIPLLIAMPFKPNYNKPLGKSRITPAVMSITDEMQREIMRTSLHAEVYSSGQKAILDLSDDQFETLNANKYRAAISEMLLLTSNDDGTSPTVTNFEQQSMTPHIEAMELLMQRMAAETAVPVAAYGLSSNGYTSSDALRASSDDLIIEAEALNRNNGKTICEIARLAYAIANNKTLADLRSEDFDIKVHWIEPSMPSAASVADATTKLASVVPAFGGTEVFWELNGFNEEQRRRVRSEIENNTLLASAASILGA